MSTLKDNTGSKPKRSSIPDGFNMPKASQTSNSQKLSWPVGSGDRSALKGSQHDLSANWPKGYCESTAKLGDRGHSKPDNLSRGGK